MNIIQNNSHPIYEADQVLTNVHLNEMFNYLEEQQRLSRAKLIGSGIVCGLNISLEVLEGVNSVVISKGVGLSSKGYLIALTGDGPNESSILPYFTPYEDPNEAIYSFFDGGSTQIPLFELQSQRVAGAESLANLELPITDYGVLLYLECFDKQLKNCIENDCNEKGVERIFTLRKLLVSKIDLRKIICQEKDLNVPKSETEIDELVNARYYLSPVKLPRFRTNEKDITTSSQLLTIYKDLINKSASLLFAKIQNQLNFLEPILKKEVNVKQKLANLLNKPSLNEVCDLQYAYDFLCDVADTHNELADAAFDLIAECCPDLNRYPKHLRLGDLNLEASCPPSPYRSRFVQSPIHNHQHQQKEKVLALFQRLIAVLMSFRSVKNFKTVKITPSVALSQPLSNKAIPYYYNVDTHFLKNWNANLKRKCKELENLSYHATDYATADHVLNPLKYDLTAFDFYNIEGHICKDYRVALKEILTIRNQMNLPFDVIALKLSRDPRGTEFDRLTCNFKDLEIMCHAWKSELRCLLGKVIKKVTRVGIKDTIRDVAVSPGTVVTDTDNVFTTNTGAGVQPGAAIREDLRVTDLSSRFGNELIFGGAALEAKIAGPLVFDDVVDKVETKEDTIGGVLRVAMEQERDICKYDSHGIQQILLFEGVAALPLQDMLVAYQYPLELSVSLLAFAKLLDQDCEKMDMVALGKTLKEMNVRANRYTTALKSYKSRVNSKVNIDYEGMMQITMLLISNCTFKSLVDIRKEMARRKEEVMRMNLFHEYVKKNPGIAHKGGVPEGGTFILVYTGDDDFAGTGSSGTGSSNRFDVKGRITDENGEPLIGATIFVKGTTIGTTTDINGKYKLKNVPGGTQTLVISFIGFETVELVVDGDAELDVVLAPPDPNKPAEGIVIADFFVPYLCCSDCPPVAYVFPKGKDEVEEEVVGLDLAKKSFCIPDDEKTYAFIVAPVEGVVSGEGVTGDAAGGFFFTPDTVDFGSEVLKKVTFEVNGTAVPLEAQLEKTPGVNFECEVEWRADSDQKIKPFINMLIDGYDARFTYLWRVIASFETGKKTILEEAQPQNIEKSTFVLSGVKEGTNLFVELTGTNRKCSDSNSKETVVPKLEVPVDISFNLRIGDKPLNAPFRFRNNLTNTITINASPIGEFEVGTSFKTLQLKDLGKSEDGNSMVYQFTPNRKPIGVYTLTYKIDNQVKDLVIQITDPDINDLFTPRDSLGTLVTDSRITNVLGRNSPAVVGTMNISRSITGRMANPELARDLAAGGFNDNFVKTLEPAMEDSTNQIIKANNSATASNTAKQNIMLDVYRDQLGMLLEMVAMQREDISTQNALSKMMTTVKGQISKMKKAGVKVDVSKKTQKVINDANKKLSGKPKAKKRFKELLKAVTG